MATTRRAAAAADADAAAAAAADAAANNANADANSGALASSASSVKSGTGATLPPGRASTDNVSEVLQADAPPAKAVKKAAAPKGSRVKSRAVVENSDDEVGEITEAPAAKAPKAKTLGKVVGVLKKVVGAKSAKVKSKAVVESSDNDDDEAVEIADAPSATSQKAKAKSKPKPPPKAKAAPVASKNKAPDAEGSNVHAYVDAGPGPDDTAAVSEAEGGDAEFQSFIRPPPKRGGRGRGAAPTGRGRGAAPTGRGRGAAPTGRGRGAAPTASTNSKKRRRVDDDAPIEVDRVPVPTILPTGSTLDDGVLQMDAILTAATDIVNKAKTLAQGQGRALAPEWQNAQLRELKQALGQVVGLSEEEMQPEGRRYKHSLPSSDDESGAPPPEPPTGEAQGQVGAKKKKAAARSKKTAPPPEDDEDDDKAPPQFSMFDAADDADETLDYELTPGPLSNAQAEEFHTFWKSVEAHVRKCARLWRKRPEYLWELAKVVVKMKRKRNPWNMWTRRWSLLEPHKDGESVPEYRERCKQAYNAATVNKTAEELELLVKQLNAWCDRYEKEVANDVVADGSLFKVMKKILNDLESSTRSAYTHYEIAVFGFVVCLKPGDIAGAAANGMFANNDLAYKFLKDMDINFRDLLAEFAVFCGARKLAEKALADHSERGLARVAGKAQPMKRNAVSAALLSFQRLVSPRNTINWATFDVELLKRNLRICGWPHEVIPLYEVTAGKFPAAQLVPILTALYAALRRVEDGDADAVEDHAAAAKTGLRIEAIPAQHLKYRDNKRDTALWNTVAIWITNKGKTLRTVAQCGSRSQKQKIKDDGASIEDVTDIMNAEPPTEPPIVPPPVIARPPVPHISLPVVPAAPLVPQAFNPVGGGPLENEQRRFPPVQDDVMEVQSNGFDSSDSMDYDMEDAEGSVEDDLAYEACDGQPSPPPQASWSVARVLSDRTNDTTVIRTIDEEKLAYPTAFTSSLERALDAQPRVPTHAGSALTSYTGANTAPAPVHGGSALTSYTGADNALPLAPAYGGSALTSYTGDNTAPPPAPAYGNSALTSYTGGDGAPPRVPSYKAPRAAYTSSLAGALDPPALPLAPHVSTASTATASSLAGALDPPAPASTAPTAGAAFVIRIAKGLDATRRILRFEIDSTYHENLIKMVARAGTQVRGETANAARDLVGSQFQLGQPKGTVEENKRFVEFLVSNGNFLYRKLEYEVVDDQTIRCTARSGPYRHSIINTLIEQEFFHGHERMAVAEETAALFNPIPIAVIAFAATAAQCALRDWISGVRVKSSSSFSADEWTAMYQGHVRELTRMQEAKPVEVDAWLRSVWKKAWRTTRQHLAGATADVSFITTAEMDDFSGIVDDE